MPVADQNCNWNSRGRWQLTIDLLNLKSSHDLSLIRIKRRADCGYQPVKYVKYEEGVNDGNANDEDE